MSGTSLDGLDLCTVRFTLKDGGWTYEIIAAETVPHPPALLQKIVDSYGVQSPSELKEIDAELSSHINLQVQQHLAQHLSDGSIDAIGSHGHTVFHQPQRKLTIQIGNRPELAENLHVPVVCNFRVQDVELGGQGAPLVPIGDRLLFSEYDACVNMGGFSNVSTEKDGKRIAWDMGPLNIGINYYCQKLGLEYDAHGKIASAHVPDNAVLEELNQLTYYAAPHPKSLGREWLEENVLSKTEHLSPEVAIATLSHHAAHVIASDLNRVNAQTALFTGGGVYNSYIMQLIGEQFNGEIHIPDSQTIEFKEALIFGFLALLKLRGEVNVLASVTGASHDHSSGVIYNEA